MTGSSHHGPTVRYRVWLARYSAGQPKSHEDAPLDTVALEPAERGTFSARGANRYVRAFNRAILRQTDCKIWAVAVPVAVRYEGDAQAGQELPPARKKNPLCVC